MDLLTIIGIVSVAFTGLSEAAGVLPDDLDAAVGEAVMFNTSLSSTETPLTVTWIFTNESNEEVTIITSVPANNNTNPQYEDRITLFRSTGSLELRNVFQNDSGPYRVSIVTTVGATRLGSTSLRVHVPITGAKLTISSEDLLEFNSSVTFSCSVSSGSSLSFLWQNISSEISASDKVQITDGGANLTILNVTRYDQGPFNCTVFNPVSRDVSDPVTLSISYGPDDVDLQVSPAQDYFEEGSNITLTCSSASSPPARLQWFLNDTLLPNTGPELFLSDATEAQSGRYSCQAFNSKTLRYKTSRTTVTVLVKITAASITASTNVSIEGKNMTLSCDAAGSVYSRWWTKDGTALTPDDNVMLDDVNRTLSLKSVRKTDGGEYSCMQSNPIHNSRVDYRMVVNFGPEQVTITGLDKVEVKASVTLTCTAASTPASSFTWKVNGTVTQYSSVFTIEEAKLSDSGSYVCEARNNVTRKAMTATHELSVTEITSSCSSGCIAGIVVACIVVVVAAAVGGFYLYKRRKNRSKRSSRRGENNPSFAESQSQDLNYAEVRFRQKANGESVQLGLSDNTTDYAEVRVNKAPSSPPTYDAHVKRTKNQAPHPGSNHT